MRAKDFLKRQIKEQNNHFFSWIRFKRAAKLHNEKKNYKWQPPYKIYPSSLKSLTMCPKKFIEEDVHKHPGFDVPVIYKLEMGKIIHEMLQNQALDIEEHTLVEVLDDLAEDYLKALDTYIRYMYKREVSTDDKLLWARPRKLSDELEQKMAKSWPEVPGFDEESGVSFRTDLIINIDDSPAILDLKTTSIDPDRWVDSLTRLPYDEHELQVRVYRYFLNRQNYYDKPITKVGLGYINMVMVSGEENQEYEVYKDFGTGVDLEVEDLIKHLTIQRKAFLSGSKSECEYTKCREHAGG